MENLNFDKAITLHAENRIRYTPPGHCSCEC